MDESPLQRSAPTPASLPSARCGLELSLSPAAECLPWVWECPPCAPDESDSSCSQLLLQLAEHLLFCSAGHNALDRFAIYARRAAVAPYLSPGFPQHVVAPYLVVQTVELHSLGLLGCAI